MSEDFEPFTGWHPDDDAEPDFAALEERALGAIALALRRQVYGNETTLRLWAESRAALAGVSITSVTSAGTKHRPLVEDNERVAPECGTGPARHLVALLLDRAIRVWRSRDDNAAALARAMAEFRSECKAFEVDSKSIEAVIANLE
jgi:hypothetical protein